MQNQELLDIYGAAFLAVRDLFNVTLSWLDLLSLLDWTRTLF